jgi:hypothetical protein
MTVTGTDHAAAAPARADALPPRLVDDFLRHIGLTRRPDVGPEGLADLYRLWSAFVPYDNYLVRRSLTDDPGIPVRSVPPDELLANSIRHGYASQCTDTGQALFALLSALGFPVLLGKGHFGPTDEEPQTINHVSVVATFDDEWYAVDPVLLSGEPIPLREGYDATIAPLPYRVRWWREGWAIDTYSPVAGSPISMRMASTTTDPSVCPRIFETVQGAGFHDFNSGFYIRRNLYGEMLTLYRFKLTRTTVGDKTSMSCEGDARVGVLRAVFGLSADLAARIPEDAPKPTE